MSAPATHLARFWVHRLGYTRPMQYSSKAVLIFALPVALYVFVAFTPRAWGQQTSASEVSVPSRVSPPVNHESGTVEEIISAHDAGFRFRGYMVRWRSSRIFVLGTSAETRAVGDTLNLLVYRVDADGRHVLRFSSNPSSADGPAAADETDGSSASVTLGTAKVEEVVAAENEGYRFVAYVIMWHDKRVVVIDPRSASNQAPGDQINFRVLRTGVDDNRQLSFSLSK